MQPTPDTRVRIADLPAHRHVALPSAFVREAIDGLPLYAALERPDDDADAGEAVAEIDLYEESSNVFARGRLRGWLAAACSRCVGPVRVGVDEPLAVTFMPRHAMPAEDEQDGDDAAAEPTEDDLDLFPYDGDEIDLEPLLREQLVLAMPFAPLCAEDCKGLCPQCGADLNQTTCQCDRTPIDPRLAALKDIKL